MLSSGFLFMYGDLSLLYLLGREKKTEETENFLFSSHPKHKPSGDTACTRFTMAHSMIYGKYF
jgi:hypothetical protein